MKFSILFFLFLSLNACANKKISNNQYAEWTGTFKCPAYKEGTPETGVDSKGMTFTQEIKEVNGKIIMVTHRIAGDIQKNEAASVNIIDGQWHIRDFSPRKGDMKTKKVFVEFLKDNKIHWISETAPYVDHKGIKRNIKKAEGHMWLDKNGNMNYTADYYKQQTVCPRVKTTVSLQLQFLKRFIAEKDNSFKINKDMKNLRFMSLFSGLT